MSDTERLIEEAQRLAASFRDPEKKQNLHLAQTLTDLVTALARLTTPRPIAEAPRDGTWIGAVWDDMTPEDCARYGPIAVVRWSDSGKCWKDSDGDEYEPSHFLPLPVLP